MRAWHRGGANRCFEEGVKPVSDPDFCPNENENFESSMHGLNDSLNKQEESADSMIVH
jgi:hypothetical protein